MFRSEKPRVAVAKIIGYLLVQEISPGSPRIRKISVSPRRLLRYCALRKESGNFFTRFKLLLNDTIEESAGIPDGRSEVGQLVCRLLCRSCGTSIWLKEYSVLSYLCSDDGAEELEIFSYCRSCSKILEIISAEEFVGEGDSLLSDE